MFISQGLVDFFNVCYVKNTLVSKTISRRPYKIYVYYKKNS